MEKETKILIVEDEEYVYIFLRTILKEMKIKKIVRVKNGRDAVEYCTKNNDISLVLMDLVMPIMDGYEATRKIKLLKPNLPIIAQTALAMTDDEQKALDAGCDDYISKPIIREHLIDLVNKHLKK